VNQFKKYKLNDKFRKVSQGRGQLGPTCRKGVSHGKICASGFIIQGAR